MTQIHRLSLTFTLLLLAGFGLATQAQVLPSKQWRSVHIGSFDLIYDAENQELAEVYARRLQHLTEPMAQDWVSFPRQTVFVLNDRTDLTNGYATFLPYSLVMIYPALPGPMETIGEYNDWAWEISVHEFTHILEFEQRRGVVWGLSKIFGSLMTPNTLLPRWWLEGAAVEAETRFSNAGRLRSKMQGGTIRALAQSPRWNELQLPEINEASIPTWPYGSRPYLYGSLLWSDWVAEKGSLAVRDPHSAMGGRVPYFLAGALTPTFDGRDQVRLFFDTKEQTQQRARQEIQSLEMIPLTSGEPVDPEMVESLSPAVSPDGLKLAYIGKNETLRRRIQVLVRPRKDVAFDPKHRIQWFGREYEVGGSSPSPIPREDSPPGGNINRISWHPESRSFVFDQLLDKNRFQEVSDLWSFDLSTGKASRLTRDARAREPSYSPAGMRIAFVEVAAGRTHLALLHLPEGRIERIFNSPLQARVSFPVWMDENTLLFSLREQGEEKVIRLDLPTGEKTQVLTSWKDPQFLSVEKDRILFTSTQNGVRNLYEATPDLRSAKPITHSLSHVMAASYDESQKKYYYTEITDRGFTLKSLPGVSVTSLPAQLPALQSFWQTRYPTTSSKALPFADEKAPLLEKSEDYSPWSYLWPRYWFPMFTQDELGSSISVLTSGSDPLQKHAYSVTASYDTALRRTSYILSYTNQVFWPRLNFTGYDYSQRLASSLSFSRTQLLRGVASWEISQVSPDFFVGVGGQTSIRERFEQVTERRGPVLTASYQHAFQSGEQISPESGWLASLQLAGLNDPALRRNIATAEGSVATFFSRWLPQRNVIMLKAQGRYSDEPFRVETMEQSLSTRSLSNSPLPEYLNRGYPGGTFLGRNILGTTFEYRFPIRRFDQGTEYIPFFLYRLHGALVADGLYLDGYAYDFKNLTGYSRLDWGKGYWSAGIEARFDVNVGFHIPLTTAWGLYWPLDRQFVEDGPRFGLSLVL